MTTKATADFANLTIEDAYRVLTTSTTGLTEDEAKRRINELGYNELSEKRKNPFIDFLERYWGPMPWLLELTMVLSYIIGHYLEVVIVFALLTTNAIIGFHHTRSSLKALELLKKRLAIKAKVIRNGEWVVKDARDVVPGDIIQVGLGDLIPADGKIVAGEVSVDQSALTGESLPVTARQSGILYSSSIVKRGEAKAVVLNTGANTYFGKTAELVKIAKPKSHQQQIMSAIVKYAMYVSIAALMVVILDAALTRVVDILTIVRFALIFLMGSVPVALPAVFAIVLAVGAMQLANEGALVTRLDSIEDAASMEVLCLDKTGTITENKLSVTDPIPFQGSEKSDVALIARLASKEEIRDVIDLAVIDYAKRLSTSSEGYTQVSFTPFEPATKRSEAIIEHDGKRFRVTKGAPQVILSLCRVDDETAKNVNTNVESLSKKGYRTLAVAKSEDNDLDNLKLVGLLPLADPPRPDSKETIGELKRLGVKTKMLTGDNVAIAREIADQVGIGNRIYPMSNLTKLPEPDQASALDEYDGLAEIYPEDKYKVVKLLQSRGHIVGMTGDGVNDSPALKQAEVGIAVSDSTDVAKASASIVLTEPGLKVILNTIGTSRQIYQRMLTWVVNKVTKVIQFAGILVLGFFWLHHIVLSVLGMVLLVFANDFVTMSLATDNVKTTRSPNIWNVKNITLASLVIGALLIVEGVIAIYLGTNYYQMELGTLQTFVLLTLVFTSQFRVLIVRERGHFWASRPGRELAISSVATVIGFALLGIYGVVIPSVTTVQVLVALGLSAIFTLGVDFPKCFAFKKFAL
ncbi:MAG: plasma-membrane proton-efflux P-type ATPase [Candidatus Bathyarchaeia archaeon]|jgi:H+-transporting ATPase